MFSLPLYLTGSGDLNGLDDYILAHRDPWRAQQSQQQHCVRNELAGPRYHGDKFNFNLNMRQFDPSEISVKFDKGALTVHGKREKKGEDGSYVFREYKQMCTVPENVLHDQMKCKLDNQGILRIEAPIKQEEKKNQERHIPIEFVGGQQQQQAIKK